MSLFLEKCEERDYTNERTHVHHILPKKMGGRDDDGNLVELSHDDHIQAHFLLSECFGQNTYGKKMNLWSAKFIKRQTKLTEEQWQKISDSMKGENNPFYGESHDEDTKKHLAKLASKQRKNKSYEEIYGEERAKKEREKRSKKTRTDEEYKRDAKKVSKTLSGTREGGTNPNAQPYLVNGDYFGSRTEVTEYFGRAFVTIEKYNNVRKIDN